jgi:hypothetical protein
MDIMLGPLATAMREAIAITTAEETIKPPPGSIRPTVYFAMQVGMEKVVIVPTPTRHSARWQGAYAAAIPSVQHSQRLRSTSVASCITLSHWRCV